MHILSSQQDKLPSDLQSDAFNYFIHEVNPNNGLVADCTKGGWPSSIAAVGMALSAYPVGVEHGFIPREEAIERTLRKLRFFSCSEQCTSPDATRSNRFFYPLLPMPTDPPPFQLCPSTI